MHVHWAEQSLHWKAQQILICVTGLRIPQTNLQDTDHCPPTYLQHTYISTIIPTYHLRTTYSLSLHGFGSAHTGLTKPMCEPTCGCHCTPTATKPFVLLTAVNMQHLS
mmetsp:Transcript_150495/g.262984  ORF Transcript_150495/g.262984 Transcript_150495/m.262984 type:complete len:108 (+) Transcript_150495:1055-1378(+)